MRNIAGTPIHLASIEDMITLKKAAGREQDLSDIAHLERLQWVDEARMFTLMAQTPETKARHEALRKGNAKK